MSGVKIQDVVDRYCSQKEVQKETDKELKKLSAQIKNYMAEHSDEDVSTKAFTVHIQVRPSESVNEDQMLEVLKNAMGDSCPFIRTKEYVDFDALEAAIYNDEVSKETLLELDKCRTVNTTRALTYKRNKEEDEENG